MIHNNYEKITDEQRKHVDNMYDIIDKYARENGIKLVYDDRAEKFVESIATYIVESE